MANERQAKRVLVHVGYPKAASTTLQNGLFLDLHRRGEINFIARAWESGYFGSLSSHAAYKIWLGQLLDAAQKGSRGPGLPPGTALSGNTINLLSEGLLMNNERHPDRFVMPAAVEALFSGVAEDVQILIVARRQSSLLMSYFVHNFKKLKARTFPEFLQRCRDEGWSGRYKIFNLHNAASAYAQQFGRERVHVLLFEDLVQNPRNFAASLAALLSVEPASVAETLQGKHFNKTKSDGGIQVVRKLEPWSPRALARRVVSAFPGSLDRLFNVKVPKLTPEEDAAIMELFKESNAALAEDFGLDMAKMRAYRFC